jgi:hypothetical protein
VSYLNYIGNQKIVYGLNLGFQDYEGNGKHEITTLVNEVWWVLYSAAWAHLEVVWRLGNTFSLRDEYT